MAREIFKEGKWVSTEETWRRQVEELQTKGSRRELAPEEESQLRELQDKLDELRGGGKKPTPKFHI